MLAVNELVYNPKLVFCLKPMVFDEPGVIPQEIMQKRINAYTHKLTACLQEGATAILCGSDGTAYWVCKACEQLDLKIPRDISLCAFDGQYELPSLQMSTVSQNLYTIGKRAAEMLVEAIESNVKQVRHEKVSVNFVVRQSARRLLSGESAPQLNSSVTR